MSDTTQYPDGLYLVTWPDGTQDAGSVQAYRNGSIIKCLDSGRWRIDYLERDGCTLTPLVPAYDYLAAHQCIADLEAEVERLRQEQWTPVADGEYTIGNIWPTVIEVNDDVIEVSNTGFRLPPNLRLCKQGKL